MTQNIWKLSRSSLHRQERRAQTVVFYLDVNEADIILDVGCGEGFISSYLVTGSFVVGLDISKISLLAAKQNVKQSNVAFINADVTALPFKFGAFNKATLLEVLEHLPPEKQKTLCNEVSRVLKDKGTFLISVPYKEQITYTICIHCGKSTPLWGHLCSLDDEKVTNLLPYGYSLSDRYHLPNVPLISLSKVFESLPFSVWLKLNNLLGHIRKGYWIILKYKKVNKKSD